MSIFIKGFELPKNCGKCIFRYNYICMLNHEMVFKSTNNRHENCPLIEDSSVVSREDYEGLELVCKNYEEALKDAVDELEKNDRKKGEWDMFDLISSAYYGKGMYFKQDNGMVYSRHSGEYMTVDEAIREFISLIDEGNVVCVPSVTTAWADGEAPTYVLQKRGKWLHKKITADFHAIGQCSVCKERRRIDNYCPNCGAQMERSEE